MMYILLFLWTGSLCCAAAGEEELDISSLQPLRERTFEEWREHLVEKSFAAAPATQEKFHAWQKLREEWRKKTEFKTFIYKNEGLKIGATLVHDKETSLLDASKKHPLYVVVRDGMGTHNEFNPLNLGVMWRMVQEGFIAVGSHYRGGEFSDGEDHYYDEGAARDVVRLIAIASQWPAVDRDNIVLEGHMRGATVALQVDRIAERAYRMMLLVSPILDLSAKMLEMEVDTPEMQIWREFFGIDALNPFAKNWQAYKDLSPVSWAKEIKTPLLIINGGRNLNCKTDEQIAPFMQAITDAGNQTRVVFHEYPEIGYLALHPGPGYTLENPMGGETVQRLLAFKEEL